MSWKHIERVQLPDALLLQGSEQGLASTITHICEYPKKSALYNDLQIAHGENWLAVFAARSDNDLEIILPRLENALSLYECAPNCWLPIGVGLDMPTHVQKDFIEKLKKQHDISTQAFIIVPKFSAKDSSTSVADIYLVLERIRLSQFSTSSKVGAL